jgi:hypothetical protein
MVVAMGGNLFFMDFEFTVRGAKFAAVRAIALW